MQRLPRLSCFKQKYNNDFAKFNSERYLKDNTFFAPFDLKTCSHVTVFGHHLFLEAHRFPKSFSRAFSSRKIVCFSKIMSADKYPNNFTSNESYCL